MPVKAFVGGPLGATAYLVYDHAAGVGAIVDAPLGVSRQLLQFVAQERLNIIYVVNTHGHWDHIAENNTLTSATGAALCAHVWDATRMAHPELGAEEPDLYLASVVPGSKAGLYLHDGELLQVGELLLEVLHTPGHTPGSICLYVEHEAALFTGDTLLVMQVGSTNLPGGNPAHLGESLAKLARLPDRTRVYPGRGLPTSIKLERWLLELASAEMK